MGFMDKVRKQASGAVDKHGDKIAKGLDTAADKANRATKGKYAAKIDKGVSKAKDGLDKRDPGTGGPTGSAGSTGPRP